MCKTDNYTSHEGSQTHVACCLQGGHDQSAGVLVLQSGNGLEVVCHNKVASNQTKLIHFHMMCLATDVFCFLLDCTGR